MAFSCIAYIQIVQILIFFSYVSIVIATWYNTRNSPYNIYATHISVVVAITINMTDLIAQTDVIKASLLPMFDHFIGIKPTRATHTDPEKYIWLP